MGALEKGARAKANAASALNKGGSGCPWLIMKTGLTVWTTATVIKFALGARK